MPESDELGVDHRFPETSSAARSPKDLDRVQSPVGRLWAHAALLLVVLFGLLLFIDNGHAVVPDEGVYLAQASNLVDGSWSSARPAPDVDPEGFFTPVTDGGVIGNRVVPYFRHALYPLLITPAFALFGVAGALAMSVIGTWSAAVVAAFLARRIDGRYGPWTLWIVGIGSPLFFDAFIVVGHSIVAALAGLMLLGLARALDDHRPAHLAYALPAVAVAVALRSEAVLLVAATGAVIGLMALGVPRRRPMNWIGVLIAAAVVGTGAITYIADSRTGQWIIGGDSPANNVTQRLASDSVNPLGGAWASLLRPFDGSWVNAGFFVPLAALGVILAATALKIMPKRTLMPMALLLGAAAAAIGMLVQTPGLVTGMLAVFPILPAGLILLARADLRSPDVRRMLGIAGLTAALILVSIYEVGGAAEWGGRFFHLLLPGLVPLAVLGLDHGRQRLGPRERLVALAALGLVTLALSTSAIRFQSDGHRAVADTVDGTIAYALRTSGDDTPLVIVAKLYGDGSGRLFWNESESADVLSSYNLGLLYPLLRQAKAVGRDRVVITTDVSGTLLAKALDGALRELNWEVLDSASTPDGTATLVTVGSQ